MMFREFFSDAGERQERRSHLSIGGQTEVRARNRRVTIATRRGELVYAEVSNRKGESRIRAPHTSCRGRVEGAISPEGKS